jgi:2-haloacid dehalogenase
MKTQAVIFDAYGTLFDVHSVVKRVRGDSEELRTLSALWRQKQIEHTWRRALMQRYADFWQVTREALRSAAESLRIKLSRAEFDALMDAYRSPDIFPEVRAALDMLKPLPMAILSNGSPEMLAAAVDGNRLRSFFSHVISVDELKTYKPSPAVYELGTRALGAPAEAILFVSSNAWDVAGAKSFGFAACWCNRSAQAPDCLGFDPELTVSRLDEIRAA